MIIVDRNKLFSLWHVAGFSLTDDDRRLKIAKKKKIKPVSHKWFSPPGLHVTNTQNHNAYNKYFYLC